jgi:hypothetical protein
MTLDVIDAAATTAIRRRVVPIMRAGMLAQAICRRGGRADVAAVFDHSLHVRIGDEFLCIGEPAIGNGPLTLIAATGVSSLGLHRRQAASIAEQRIVIGDLRFDLDLCETWRPPRWPVPTVRPGDIGAAIARRAAIESPPDGLAYALFAANETPLARTARPRVRRFEAWLSDVRFRSRPTASHILLPYHVQVEPLAPTLPPVGGRRPPVLGLKKADAKRRLWLRGSRE